MSNNHDRRGFLRSLAGLPLIGGGVTLLGNPTAAAEPITRRLLDAYDEWLDLERSFLKWERYGMAGRNVPDRAPYEAVLRWRHSGELFDSRAVNAVSHPRLGLPGDSPSSRAAVVLAAAGASWSREG